RLPDEGAQRLLRRDGVAERELVHGILSRLGAGSLRGQLSTPNPASPERGDDLAGHDVERATHLREREEAARIQLGDDAVEAELVAQAAEAVDEARTRPEHRPGLDDPVVRELL